MDTNSAITLWLAQLQTGNEHAAEQLWQRYFERLVEIARQKLQGRAVRAADEEDVALSAFNSFCLGAQQGRFPQLNDREGLWRLLVVITAYKALHLLRDEGRQKRGGNRVVSLQHTEEDEAIQEIIGSEPTPEFAAQVAEECQRLLAVLGDATLELIAVRKMEGYSNTDIATILDCSGRTVERKLRLIRHIWERQLA